MTEDGARIVRNYFWLRGRNGTSRMVRAVANSQATEAGKLVAVAKIAVGAGAVAAAYQALASLGLSIGG